MYFQYDTNGTPLGFIYNGTQYLYMTNQMGDVIAITEADGEGVAEYEYDEWGNVLNVYTANEDNAEQSEVANVNPLRYRGYYYDTETGYYYLQSRYYDASICRFINADIPEFMRQHKDEYAGLNLFAYCCNDPVNNIDPNGTWGKDVHDGYNPDTKDHFCYLDFDGVKEYYGTYYWAKIIGYNDELAKTLGMYDNYVDRVFGSTGPNWKEYDKWHFYTADGRDVRFNISYDEQSKAKSYLNVATIAYRKWQNYKLNFGKFNLMTIKEYDKYKTNLVSGIMHLGFSMHPIQDVYSHTRNVCFQFENDRWYHLPGNVDNANMHTYAVLGPTASKTLEILLTFYNTYYILRLNSSPIYI